jgi:hypothetical protein
MLHFMKFKHFEHTHTHTHTHRTKYAQQHARTIFMNKSHKVQQDVFVLRGGSALTYMTRDLKRMRLVLAHNE